MAQFLEVKPGELCLPSGRQEGAVAKRYFDQVRRFGGKTDGMPLIQVTEGQDGELMINDGVTRATRIHNLSPDSLSWSKSSTGGLMRTFTCFKEFATLPHRNKEEKPCEILFAFVQFSKKSKESGYNTPSGDWANSSRI